MSNAEGDRADATSASSSASVMLSWKHHPRSQHETLKSKRAASSAHQIAHLLPSSNLRQSWWPYSRGQD
eukprot:1601162-Rhodomonas_salina.2